jgi:O-antigen ligase
VTSGRGSMRVLTLHHGWNLPLVGAVVALSVLVGVAAGTGWTLPFVIAAGLGLFLVLVRDIRLIAPLLILLIPLGPKFEMGFGNLHLATALLIVGVVAWLWRNPLAPRPLSLPLNHVLVALVVLSAVLGLSALQVVPLLLGDPALFLRLIQFFLYTALFAMVLQIGFSPADVKKLLIFALLVGVVEAMAGLRQWLIQPGFYVSGTFDGQHNHFAIFIVFIALLLLGAVLETKSLLLRLAGLAGLALMVFGIVFSFSRGGYVAFAAGTLTFFLMPVRRKMKVVLALAAAASAVAVLVSVPAVIRERAYSIFLNVSGQQEGISFAMRLKMWRSGLADFAAHPVLGRGTWTSGLKDNFYLKVLAEAGILGFAAFLGLVYVVLREEWKLVRLGIEDDFMRGIAHGLFAATIACLVVYNLSGDFFGVHRFMGVFWIVVALLLVYGPALARRVDDGA